MSGEILVIDSNIIIYALNQNIKALNYIEEDFCYISFISEIEVKCSEKLTERDYLNIDNLLKNTRQININCEIIEKAILIRKIYKLRIPDAIVAATTFYLDVPIITADKQFTKVKDIEVILFEFNA